MGKFSETLDASLEWTAAVLFRPFNLKKWLLLSFVALLSGAMAGSNFNLNLPSDRPSTCEKKSESGAVAKPSDEIANFKAALVKYSPAIIALAVLLGVMIVVFLWLGSRFSFVFLDDVVKNDASIRRPFFEHKPLGESLFQFYFLFSLVFWAALGLIVFGCVFTLRAMGVFSNWQAVGALKIALTCVPFLFGMIVLFIVSGIAAFLINNFTVIVMYHDRCTVVTAIGRTWAILRSHAADCVKFALLKFAAGLGCSLAYTIIVFIVCLGLLIPGLIIIGIGYGIGHSLPAFWKTVGVALGIIILIPLALAIGYCLTCVYLPAAVFLRTLGLKFLARLESRYDVWNPEPGGRV